MEEILITIVIEIRINLLHMFRQYKLQFLLPPLLLEEEPKHCLQAKGFHLYESAYALLSCDFV